MSASSPPPPAALDLTSEMKQLCVTKENTRTSAKQIKAHRDRLSQRNWRALKKRIGSLPQELQDDILKHTISFQPNENNIVRITKKYKPPLGMQVSWHTRAAFVKEYYGSAVFHIHSAKHSLMSTTSTEFTKHRKASPDIICHSWLSSLVTSERDLIKTVRLEYVRAIYGPTAAQGASTTMHIALNETGGMIRSRFRRGWVCTRSDYRRPQFDIRPEVLVFSNEDENEWYRCKERTAEETARADQVERIRLSFVNHPGYHHKPFSICPADLVRQRLDRQATPDVR